MYDFYRLCYQPSSGEQHDLFVYIHVMPNNMCDLFACVNCYAEQYAHVYDFFVYVVVANNMWFVRVC